MAPFVTHISSSPSITPAHLRLPLGVLLLAVALEGELARLKERIGKRQAARERLIRRRAEELLDDGDTEW